MYPVTHMPNRLSPRRRNNYHDYPAAMFQALELFRQHGHVAIPMANAKEAGASAYNFRTFLSYIRNSDDTDEYTQELKRFTRDIVVRRTCSPSGEHFMCLELNPIVRGMREIVGSGPLQSLTQDLPHTEPQRNPAAHPTAGTSAAPNPILPSDSGPTSTVQVGRDT